MKRTLPLVAIVFASLFTGACFVVATILVPFWKTMEPVAFLDYFAIWSPSIGQTMILLEGLSQLFLIVACLSARQDERSFKWWLFSAVTFSLTFLMFVIYFSKVNMGIETKTIDLAIVPEELVRWQMMHWIRTLVALSAVCLGLFATVQQMSKR